MKTAFRILILFLVNQVFDCLGVIMEYIFDDPYLRLGYVSSGGLVMGYLVRGWWPPKKEGAE